MDSTPFAMVTVVTLLHPCSVECICGTGLCGSSLVDIGCVVVCGFGHAVEGGYESGLDSLQAGKGKAREKKKSLC